jgi:hypothetical protein
MASNRVPSMEEMTAYLGLTIDEEPVASLCAGCKYKEWPFVKRRYLMSRSRGFEVKYGPERVVETIFLNRFGRNRYAQFAGKLPNGIKFGDPPDRVRAALGKPTSSGRPGPGVQANSGSWDRYDKPDHRIHFSYSEEGGLDQVMLMLARAKSRKASKAR